MKYYPSRLLDIKIKPEIHEEVVTRFFKNNKSLLKNPSIRSEVDTFFRKIYIFKKDMSKIIKSLSTKNEMEVCEKQMFSLLDNFFKSAASFEQAIKDRRIIMPVKKIFLASLQKYFHKSFFGKYGHSKPKGYPGDYIIVEAIYNNKVIANNKFGQLLDKYFLNIDYVRAIRDRKDFMKALLQKFLFDHSTRKNIRIFNLACGSCREIRELMKEGFFLEKNIVFSVLDKEVDSLSFAKVEIEKITKDNINNWVINYLNRDLFELFNSQNFEREAIEKQDLIYSIGVADYLPDSIFGPLIKHSFDLLKKNGKLIIAHKNIREFNSTISDWGADWNFFPRSSNHFLKLIRVKLEKNDYYCQKIYLPLKRIFFIIINKR